MFKKLSILLLLVHLIAIPAISQDKESPLTANVIEKSEIPGGIIWTESVGTDKFAVLTLEGSYTVVGIVSIEGGYDEIYRIKYDGNPTSLIPVLFTDERAVFGITSIGASGFPVLDFVDVHNSGTGWEFQMPEHYEFSDDFRILDHIASGRLFSFDSECTTADLSEGSGEYSFTMRCGTEFYSYTSSGVDWWSLEVNSNNRITEKIVFTRDESVTLTDSSDQKILRDALLSGLTFDLGFGCVPVYKIEIVEVNEKLGIEPSSLRPSSEATVSLHAECNYPINQNEVNRVFTITEDGSFKYQQNPGYGLFALAFREDRVDGFNGDAITVDNYAWVDGKAYNLINTTSGDVFYYNIDQLREQQVQMHELYISGCPLIVDLIQTTDDLYVFCMNIGGENWFAEIDLVKSY